MTTGFPFTPIISFTCSFFIQHKFLLFVFRIAAKELGDDKEGCWKEEVMKSSEVTTWPLYQHWSVTLFIISGWPLSTQGKFNRRETTGRWRHLQVERIDWLWDSKLVGCDWLVEANKARDVQCAATVAVEKQ
jgi:hypothetical protein